MATAFSDLIDGFNKCTIRARVIRTWDAVNIKTAELYSRDMLLLDEQGICMHAQIPECIVSRMEKMFVDGRIVTIQYFSVRPAGASHRPVANNRKILFLRNTIVQSQSEDPNLAVIPQWYFDFADEDVISTRKGNHLILTDVIAMVQHVGTRREVTANGAEIPVRDVSIKLLGGSVLKLTLWGQFSNFFNETEISSLEQPVITAIAAVSVSTYQGSLTLSTTSCSQLLINPDIPEANALRTSFKSEGPVQFERLPSEPVKDDASHDQKNPTTLSEILALEWSPDFKDETYTVLARIKEINSGSGWTYIGCGLCSTKVSYEGGIQFCKKCNKPITDAAYRYKVHAMVFDETAECEFTMFDRQIFQLIKVTAAQLLTEVKSNAMEIPPQIQNLCNKTFNFEIKVSNRNLMHGWNNYTVSRILEDLTTETNPGGNSDISMQLKKFPTTEKKGKKRRYVISDSDDDNYDDLPQKVSSLQTKHSQVNKEKRKDPIVRSDNIPYDSVKAE